MDDEFAAAHGGINEEEWMHWWWYSRWITDLTNPLIPMTLYNEPAVRTQIDGRQEEFSFMSALDFREKQDDPAYQDATRQEFKEEVDVNTILRRFGVNGTMQQAPLFGDVDFDVGAHEAYLVSVQAQDAWMRVDPTVRDKYKTWQELLDAVTRGVAVIGKDGKLEEPPAPPAPTPEPAPPGTGAQ